MKKTISLLLALMMLLSLFAACGEKPATDVTPDAGQDTASDTSDAPANGTDEQTEPDKDAEIITPPDAPVVITIDQSLSGSQTPGTQTTAPQTGTPQTQTPQTQTPETQTPATQTPSSQTPSAQTPSGGNETPAQSTTPSQTTAPAAGSQLQQSPAATKAVQLNGAGTRLDTVRASAAKNLQIGVFGDSITTNDTATDFHAMAFEGGYFLPTLGGGTGYYTAYQNLTYNLYECFKWDGTKADSNITSISEARIKKTLDPDSPPLDYYIAAVSRDRSIATKDGEGRSLTAYKYLNELLHKQNPNGKLVLIVPPGYQDGCTFYSEKLSMTNMSRAEHNTLIKAFAAKLKEAIPDAIYVEAGDAFEFFIKNYASSGIDLYRTDLRSASEAGSYLIAAILYEKIFGKSVYGMDFDSHLAHEDAVLLQQAAHEFVYGSKPTSSTGHKTATPIQILFDDDPRYKNEVYPKNYDALLATAMAYYDSHILTQYDQLSPDRVLSSHVFYRRTVDGTGDPEEGSPQKTLYLDCTAFVWALLKSAFNYELPEKRSRPLAYGTSAELKPLVVWENHITADTQIDETIDNFLKTLQPGDVIAYSNPGNDRGHGVIFLGKGYIMQCSSASRFGGGSADYQYTNGSKMDSHETAGGIRIDKIDFMTDPLKLSYQFNPANDMTIRIIRPPYDKMTPTENTQNRVKNMQHIVAYKLTSAPEGVTVNPGDTVDITVVVKNRGTENKTVAVTDTLPSGLTLKSGSNNFSLTVAPGETKSQSYTVQVDAGAKPGSFIDYKTTKAGGVLLNNTPVWVNKTLTADEQKKVVAAAKAASASDSYALCKAAYDAVGITLPFDSAQKAQTNVFTSDPAFSAKKGVKFISSPYSVKYLATGLWGGLLVTSTENDHRLKYIGYENLVPGDMICVAEGDADKSEPQLYIYLGSHTIMTVKDGKTVTYTSSSACRELLERIWGEVSFYVCRPSLTR